MYKIDKIKINGFWHRLDIECNLQDDVNVIIGRNGTGKTTFMNILNSILTVDLNSLANSEFESATVILKSGANKKTIKVNTQEGDKLSLPFSIIEYQISNKKYKLRAVSRDDSRMPLAIRRRLYEESATVKGELNKLVLVSSLSVYRLRHDEEYEVRDTQGTRKIVSPVDYRLGQVLNQLTEFQLDLAEEAQEVSKELQKNVLASILFSEEDKDAAWKLSFDKEDEQSSLISAYMQLNASDSEIRKKIKYHVNAIDNAISHLRSGVNSPDFDIKPLEALRKSRKIINLSLSAKEKTQLIYSQINLFLQTLESFMSDKKFSFVSGRLVVRNEFGEIEHSKLSSGEKQLIILMIEALMQRKGKHVFLADEPELSLHIAWQRKIIPAVKDLNPNAQVIVATHSPEVASRYKDRILDMEGMINA